MTKIAIQRNNHKIDATGKILGRLATEIATKLRGKHKVNYVPYLDNGDFVFVENVEKIKVSGRKEEQKVYYSYSGYPGGIKATKYKELMDRDPKQVLRKAVYNMLPKNRLRDNMIKRLVIK